MDQKSKATSKREFSGLLSSQWEETVAASILPQDTSDKVIP